MSCIFVNVRVPYDIVRRCHNTIYFYMYGPCLYVTCSVCCMRRAFPSFSVQKAHSLVFSVCFLCSWLSEVRPLQSYIWTSWNNTIRPNTIKPNPLAYIANLPSDSTWLDRIMSRPEPVKRAKPLKSNSHPTKPNSKYEFTTKVWALEPKLGPWLIDTRLTRNENKIDLLLWKRQKFSTTAVHKIAQDSRGTTVKPMGFHVYYTPSTPLPHTHTQPARPRERNNQPATWITAHRGTFWFTAPRRQHCPSGTPPANHQTPSLKEKKSFCTEESRRHRKHGHEWWQWESNREWWCQNNVMSLC